MQENLKKISLLKMMTCETEEEKERYEIINKILQDDDCFKKMSAETAFKLISDLGFDNVETKKIYSDIIFSENRLLCY